MKSVDVFCDGACKGNPGPGGWGALLRYGEHERRMCGGEADTTNNRMELMAAIMALESLREACTVTVHTDSTYVMKGIVEWIAGWQRRSWRTADGKPVKNQELWQRLQQATARHQVEWRWVKGHAGHPGNEEADRLANAGIEAMRRSAEQGV